MNNKPYKLPRLKPEDFLGQGDARNDFNLCYQVQESYRKNGERGVRVMMNDYQAVDTRTTKIDGISFVEAVPCYGGSLTERIIELTYSRNNY